MLDINTDNDIDVALVDERGSSAYTAKRKVMKWTSGKNEGELTSILWMRKAHKRNKHG